MPTELQSITKKNQAADLQELFFTQRRYLDYFFDNIDFDQLQETFDYFLKCRGTIFFTGIGKSGIIARKISTTLVSTGTRALYLSTTNALHGDLGIVTDQDIFVLMSKSGESDELLQLAPYLRNRGTKLIALTSKENSRLSRACDHTMLLPLEKELCPFGLSPTTSGIIQLIFGDVMAVGLMKAKNFTLDQYARNHPAGSIGKRISLKVQDLMLSGENLPTCLPDEKLQSAILTLSNKKSGCVLVVDEQKKLLGIFTDGDLRRQLQRHGGEILQLPMCELMTVTARWVRPESLAYQAMVMMEEDQKRAITTMPVLTEEGVVVGLIRLHDIIQSGLSLS
jgi:arabinose-5-phosphate isomerase